MRTMRLFLSAVLLMVATTGWAQKCKFDFEEADPFTGKVKRGTTTSIYTSVISYESWYIGLNQEGDAYWMGALIELKGEYNTYLQAGDSLMIKLESGEVMTLKAADQVSPVSKAMVAGNQPVITSTYRATYPMTKEQVEKLSQSPATFIRMNIAEKPMQMEVKKKSAKDLMKDAGCLLQ